MHAIKESVTISRENEVNVFNIVWITITLNNWVRIHYIFAQLFEMIAK